MARPTKQGIDYFPLDTQLDEKIEMFIIEKEAIGLSVLVTIWQMIYSNEGYYTTNGNDLFLLIKKRINVSINDIRECINVCLERGIFDKKLHDKFKILTSKAIQKRYFEAAKRKKEVRYNPEYILLKSIKEYKNLINVNTNPINDIHLSTNVDVEVNVEEEVKEDVKVKRQKDIIEYDNDFIEFWKIYDMDIQQDECFNQWQYIDAMNRTLILKRIQNYIDSTDKDFRKEPLKYLRNKMWSDEIIKRKSGKQTTQRNTIQEFINPKTY